MKKNIAIPFSSATHLQTFCDKCYIRCRHSDISNAVNLGSGFDFTDNFTRFRRRSELSEDGCF